MTIFNITKIATDCPRTILFYCSNRPLFFNRDQYINSDIIIVYISIMLHIIVLDYISI